MAIGLIGSAYAIFGGLKSVAVSDTINGVGLLVGGLAVPYLALQALGMARCSGAQHFGDGKRPVFDPTDGG